MRLTRFSLPFLAAAAALLLAACGTTEIDHARPEKLIRQSVAKLGRTTATTVSCPSGVKARKGNTFTCHATLANGASGTVTIHIADNNGKIKINGPSDYHAR